MNPRDCLQKNGLGAAWQRAVSIHNKATQEYVDKVGLAIEDDIVLLRMKAQQAKNVVQQLREQYDQHIAQHGC